MMKNKGYTLIELVIVMTITVILSAGSFVIIGIMKEAKRQSATNTFNNQISSCLIRTKAVSTATNASATDKPLCMVIKKRSDGAYALMTGYVDGGHVSDGSGGALNPDVDANCDVILPKEIINIEYESSSSAQEFPGGEMVIQFIKSYGSTKYGGGSYKLYAGSKLSSAKLYATICLDPVSGKHYIK